jgi:hypothetical protein
MVYWSIEPPLAERLEIAIATLTSMTANINRDPKKRPEPFTAKDFMRQWWEAPDQEPDDNGMSPEHVMSVMDRLMRDQDRRQKGLSSAP